MMTQMPSSESSPLGDATAMNKWVRPTNRRAFKTRALRKTAMVWQRNRPGRPPASLPVQFSWQHNCRSQVLLFHKYLAPMLRGFRIKIVTTELTGMGSGPLKAC